MATNHTPLPSHGESRCTHCGSRCYGHSEDGEPVCRDCLRLSRATAYVPQWDPQFATKVANLLIHPPSGIAGDWVRVHRELGCDSSDIRWMVRCLRRRGFIIEGQRGKGYRLTGWTHQTVRVDDMRDVPV